MKGFKNFVVLLVCALAFALATPKASAISISDMGSFSREWNWNYSRTLKYAYNYYNFFYRNGAFSPNTDVVISFNSSKEPYRSFYGVVSSANPSFMWYFNKLDWYFDLRTYDILNIEKGKQCCWLTLKNHILLLLTAVIIAVMAAIFFPWKSDNTDLQGTPKVAARLFISHKQSISYITLLTNW